MEKRKTHPHSARVSLFSTASTTAKKKDILERINPDKSRKEQPGRSQKAEGRKA